MCKSCGGGRKATSSSGAGAKATVSPTPNAKSSKQQNNTVNVKVTLPNGFAETAVFVKPQFVHLIPLSMRASSGTAIVVKQNQTFPADKALADELMRVSQSYFSLVP